MAVGMLCISEHISEIKLRDVAKRLGLSKAKLHHGSGPVDILVGIDHPALHTGETKEVQNLVARNSLGMGYFWNFPRIRVTSQ